MNAKIIIGMYISVVNILNIPLIMNLPLFYCLIIQQNRQIYLD